MVPTKNFKTFLIEFAKPVKNQVDIMYQSMLDNLDETHIEFSDDKLLFNVGKTIKNSTYNLLDFVVRIASKPAIRLGHDEQDKHAIVIDTTGKLPSRTTLKRFMEHGKYADRIKEQIKKYLKKQGDSLGESDPEKVTTYEKTKEVNTNYEAHYEKLIKAIDKKLADLGQAKDYIKNKHTDNANHAKQAVADAALGHLHSNEFGEGFNGFKSSVLKLPEAQFIKQLESEAKKKVLSRLESYWEHKF